MFEWALIYGLSSVAAAGLKALTASDAPGGGGGDDFGAGGVPGNRLDAAAVQAMAGLRERFTLHRPERNHEIQQAVRKAYFQSLLHVAVPYAELQGAQPRAWLTAAGLPNWAIEAWDALGDHTRAGVLVQADQEAVRRLLNEVLPRIRNAESDVEEVEIRELNLPFDRLEQVLGAQPTEEDIRKPLVERVRTELATYWSGGLPEGLSDLIDRHWYTAFRACFLHFVSRDPTVKAKVAVLMDVKILDVVNRLEKKFDQALPQMVVRHESVINPPRLDDPVIGRDAEAQLLLKHLRKEKAVAIVAPSFFGKTSIIRRALREVTDGVRITDESVKAILYFEGELRLSGLFGETGRLTGESDGWTEFAGSNEELAKKVSAYWSYLDRCGPVWLILDSFEANLSTPENPVLKDDAIRQWLEAFLRRQSAHRLIMASRFDPRLRGVLNLPAISRALTEGLPEEDCVELWRRVLTVEDGASDAVLRELSQRLHRMPAAIRGAAEYVNYRSSEATPEDLLRNSKFFAKFDRGDIEGGFQYVLRELIGQLQPGTRRLLRYLAELPEPVPRRALTVLADEVELIDLLEMIQTSVIVANQAKDVFGDRWYRLHGTARKVLAEESAVSTREHAHHCIREGNAAQKGKRFVLAESLQECARVIAQRLVDAGEVDALADVATALMNKGVALMEQKRYGEAVASNDRAVVSYEELVKGGRSDLREHLATALMNKGVVLQLQKSYGEAMVSYDRAVVSYEELVRGGRSDLREDVAKALMNRGVALTNQKRYEEALASCDRALASYRELVKGGRSDLRESVAKGLMNKANVLAGQKRHEEAVESYDLALESYEELVRAGRSDLRENLAMAMMNKASVLQLQKRYQEGVASYIQAIESYGELVSEGRSDLREHVAAALMNKGVALMEQKRYGEAVASYDRALETYEELMRGGRADLREDVATALTNKHVLIESQGDLAAALLLIERAVDIRRQLHAQGYRHQTEEFLRGLEWQAQTLDSMGRPADADACRTEAERIRTGGE
ncbi:MAG: tetratricopeptide repeat protein [Bryobacterales bacterium]|nr:tetratricopeptide repeat protein [Bryobacterales bacterium]